MFALGIGPGDEVIVPAMTFAASANCVVFQGASPVFADVDPETLLLIPDDAASKITPRTKAIVAVDYAGQPCAYDELRCLAEARPVGEICHWHFTELVPPAAPKGAVPAEKRQGLRREGGRAPGRAHRGGVARRRPEPASRFGQGRSGAQRLREWVHGPVRHTGL